METQLPATAETAPVWPVVELLPVPNPLTPQMTDVSIALLRALGDVLNELSTQGLLLWRDERGRWSWTWGGTRLRAEHSHPALGDALVEAVGTRHPALVGWPLES